MKFFYIFIFTVIYGFNSCLLIKTSNESPVETNKDNNYTNSIPQSDKKLVANNAIKDEVQKSPSKNIRAIDFNNYTYKWFPKYGDVKIKNKIDLKDGENPSVFIEGKGIQPNGDEYQEYLADIYYADLTGDKIEEAIVTVAVSFYKWTPQCIFVFGLKNSVPVLLWKYEIDVANSGLDWRGHKIIDNKIIIEEYDMKYGNPGSCCPLRYFSKKFAWNGKTFKEESIEIFLNDSQVKKYIGYPSEE